MKRNVLFLALFAFIFSLNAMSQCGQVSLIGEFNGWADDYNMTRDPMNPELFSAILILTAGDDTSDPPDGIVELKFRENAGWDVNWGSADFPSGIGTIGGANIPVPVGSYVVTFNCTTLEYNFETTCGNVSMIGEFNAWSDDLAMMRNPNDPNEWTAAVFFTAEDDTSDPPDGIVEMKFRENADWAVNWGSADFPNGIGTLGGANIPVPIGGYFVTFNCSTGAYDFYATCGEIGLIGEFNGWSEDFWMMRHYDNPDMWTAELALSSEDDTSDPPDGIVELKFRQNSDWGVNWGDVAFPSGTGTAGGPNIPVLLDAAGLTTDYIVTFNCATGEYNFHATSGKISMIGEFINWNGDVPMHRDMMDPDLWKVDISLPANFDFTAPPDGIVESKFRENMDWTVNWGNNTFPTGTGTDNGPNIPVEPGKYSVTFNSSTFAYNFTENNDICGGIGMVGDFNGWGIGTGSFPTDVFLLRDPMYPCLFSMEYNFASTTGLLFRMDAMTINNDNVWGGTSLCQTGVHDYTKIINVPGGKYHITFNALSGDYCFHQLGNSVAAPKVFAITVDGILNENDWKITQPVANVVDGTVGTDLNEVYFGAAWNETHLFVGIEITDSTITAFEQGEVFVDGNKSGGPYDNSDVHLKFSAAGIEVIQGPTGITPILGFQVTTTGYVAEVAIPWADLGVTPAEGGQIGFDVLIGDNDVLPGTGIEYTLAWNGGLQNYEGTSSFGDLLFGSLSCGCISVYNETIGDVILRNPTDEPTTYIGTYDLDAAYDLVFRKDMQATVQWASPDFPDGTAVLAGDPIPATTGRYRVTFDCLTGVYTFTSEPASDGVAYAQNTDIIPVIDGELTEYTLSYNSNIIAAGAGPNNNTVTWGAIWDANNLYLGVKVVDAVVEGSGNPWDNDAIEYYIDGNHDSDGAFDGDFDTQLIQDFFSNSTVDTVLWVKADGVPVTNYDAKWKLIANGYNVELRLGWENFDFAPGKGRSIGFSLGNNDSDNGIGRDYQTVWFGTGDNWNNTGLLGDLQLAGGSYFYGIYDITYDNAKVLLYPNPSTGNVNLKLLDDILGNDVKIIVSDLSGRTVLIQYAAIWGNSAVQLKTNELESGVYMVTILGADGRKAIEKMIIQ